MGRQSGQRAGQSVASSFMCLGTLQDSSLTVIFYQSTAIFNLAGFVSIRSWNNDIIIILYFRKIMKNFNMISFHVIQI